MPTTLLIAGTTVLVFVPAVALADTTVDFGPLAVQALEIILALLAVLVGWGIKVFSDRVGLEKDSELRILFDQAAANGLALARAKLEPRAKDFDLEVDLQNAMVAEAAQYVLKAIPDTLRRFRIDPEGLENRLRARLNPPPNRLELPETRGGVMPV